MGKNVTSVLSSLAVFTFLGVILCHATPSYASTTLTVGTYNLRAPKENDTNLQRSLLQDNGVEIAGLQEINHDNHRFSGTKTYDTLSNFRNDFYKYDYYGNAIDFAGGGYGIATISAFPLKDESTHKLYSAQANQHLTEMKKAYSEYDPEKKATVKALDALSEKYGTKLVEPRIYTRTTTTKDGKEIAFYNTHLSYESTKLRQKQLKELAKALKEDPTKYKILVGDFNADQNTTDWQLLKDYNLANGKDGVWRDTFIEDDPTMAVDSVDNIVTSKNITIDTVKTVQSEASDHLPLIAKLTLE